MHAYNVLVLLGLKKNQQHLWIVPLSQLQLSSLKNNDDGEYDQLLVMTGTIIFDVYQTI